MPTPPDYVTNAEFNRYIMEENAYRGRVAQLIEQQYTHISNELGEIKLMVKEANGKTAANGQAIAIIHRELDAIKAEDRSIEETVEDIKVHGCHQLANHEAVLTTLGWSQRKKAGVAAGLLTTGALAWPAIQQIAEAVHAAIERWPQ
jgi:hypothetical protein